jgi:hypothetical protein
MIIGAFFAWLPDFFAFIAWEYNISLINKIVPRPRNMFYHKDKTFLGILTQIIIFIPAVILLL